MADKRRRIYYTKAQVREGLVTEGGEWMFTDNTEYIGQYHTYTTGEVFSDATFVDGKSRILIPYVDVQSINQQNEIGIDTAKNFEYDNIKTLDVKKSITPNPNQIQPTDKDIKRGWMERYFAKKVNDDIILELTKDDFDNVGTENGLDSILWEKFTLRWRITGPIDEILQTNQQTIQIKSEDYPSITSLIVDYTEFYQI
jgi:hypothetical protein